MDCGLQLAIGMMNDDSLDRQHENLLDLIIQIEAAIRQRRSSRYVRVLLHRLIDDTVHHFIEEEALMVDRGYPLFAVHKSLHAALLDYLMGLASDYDAGLIGMNRIILDNLREWFFVHLDTQDRPLAAFLASDRGS